MLVLGGNDVTELFTECQDCLEKSVGGKYGRSREGASALFIQLYVENYCRMNISYACLREK